MRWTLNRKLVLFSGLSFTLLAVLAMTAIVHLLHLRAELDYVVRETYDLDITRDFDTTLALAIADAAAYGQSAQPAYRVAAQAELADARAVLRGDEQATGFWAENDPAHLGFVHARTELLAVVERNIAALEAAVQRGDRAAIDAATTQLFAFKADAARLEDTLDTHRRADVLAAERTATSESWLAIGSVVCLLLLLVPVAVVSYCGIQRTAIDPLRSLATAASAVAAGDFSQRVRVTNTDEIGALQQAFNRMVGELAAQCMTLHRQTDVLAWTLQDAEQARRTAEAANQAKSLFLASMSHELRTPLNAIIGYTELLREEALDAEDLNLLPDLDRVHLAGTQLLALINDILDLSKIEAGKMNVFVERVTLADVVRSVAATVAPQMEKNANVLRIETAGLPVVCETDQTKLRQILLNLLSNAAKFTRNGTVTLVAGGEHRPSGPWICFEVVDTGIGMTAQQMANLFQPFVQADASTTRKYGGTGLGLALSQRLAWLLGGHIDVSSVPGGGSTFRIWLPAVLPSAEVVTYPPSLPRMVEPETAAPPCAACARPQPLVS